MSIVVMFAPPRLAIGAERDWSLAIPRFEPRGIAAAHALEVHPPLRA